MLTEGRIGLSALAEHHEQGRGIEGLGDRADGMDGMAGLIVQGGDAQGARARFDNFRLEESQ